MSKTYAFLRSLVLAGYTAAWTLALLIPAPGGGDDGFNFGSRHGLAVKGLHVAAYTLFTMLAAWVKAPIRYRFLFMFALMGHATLTEILQNVLETGRSGRLTDVALDHIGIAIGIVLTWRWWTAV